MCWTGSGAKVWDAIRSCTPDWLRLTVNTLRAVLGEGVFVLDLRVMATLRNLAISIHRPHGDANIVAATRHGMRNPDHIRQLTRTLRSPCLFEHTPDWVYNRVRIGGGVP